MLSTIKDLREIVRCCNEGQPLSERLARWLGKALGEFLAHRAQSIEIALGLRPVRGGVPWWQEEAIRTRNEVLRQLSESFFPEKGVSAQARQVYVLALRYATSTWRFDVSQDVLPIGYEGTTKELLWKAFKSGAPMPIGERQLRTILALEKRAAAMRATEPVEVDGRRQNTKMRAKPRKSYSGRLAAMSE